MFNSFEELIEARTTNGNDYTHRLETPSEDFKIKLKADEYNSFWNLYRLIKDDEGYIIYEVLNENHPIFFKINDDPSSENFDEIIHITQTLIKESMENSENDDNKQLQCIIKYSDDNEHYHLVFPNYILSNKLQKTTLRDNLILKLIELKLYDEDIIQGVIDLSVYSEEWVLDTDETLYNVLECYNPKEVSTENRLKKICDFYTDSKNYYPRCICFYNGFTEEVNDKINKKINLYNLRVVGSLKDRVLSDFEVTAKLLEFVSLERWETQSNWEELGEIIFSITKGDEKGLLLYEKVTPDKYSNIINDTWDGFSRIDITLSLLRHWASVDSKLAYNEWCSSNINILLDKCVQMIGTFSSYAAVIYEMWKDSYICSNSDKNKWYFFKNHRWITLDKSILELRITKYIRPLFIDLLNKLSEEQKNSINEEEKQLIQDKQKICVYIIKGLGDPTFKSKVIRECKGLFLNVDFDSLRDSIPYLVCHNNGVYDLNKSEFRPGLPEDYITKSTNTEFKQDFTWEHKDVKAVLKIFRQLLPNDDKRIYLFKAMATLFYAGNSEKMVLFLLGESGDNGKSGFGRILEGLLGDYIRPLHKSLMFGKDKDTSASPELLSAMSIRAGLFHETKKGQKLNSDSIKAKTGEDGQTSRLNHSNEIINYVTSWTPIFFSNRMIESDVPEDQVLWNRFRIILFLSKFIDPKECPKTEEEQFKQRKFPRDNHFNDKIPFIVTALTWIVYEYYKIYKKEGSLITPDIVKMNTKKYVKKDNFYSQFFDQNITRDDDGAELTLKYIYDEFKNWYQECYPKTYVPNIDSFKECMESEYGVCEKGKWRGIKLCQT